MAQDRHGAPRVILDAAGVSALAARAVQAGRVALDTEFIRETTYFPELALIQLGIDAGDVALVDPVREDAPEVLEAVALLLADERVTKVLHAAPQDLEVLRVALGVVPTPLVDTQVAAALAGIGAADRQVAYAALVEAELGHVLSKGAQRADWLKRPLAPALLEYAADDVRWLPELQDRLTARLDDAQRQELATRCDALVVAARKGLDAEALADKIKGGSRLRGAARKRLVALARWREERARVSNVPRRWLLADEVLIALAQRGPKDTDALYGITALPAKARARWGADLVALCAV